MFKCQLFHFVIVYASGFTVKVVAYRIVDDTAGIYLRAMAQVASVVKIEAHECITGL